MLFPTNAHTFTDSYGADSFSSSETRQSPWQPDKISHPSTALAVNEKMYRRFHRECKRSLKIVYSSVSITTLSHINRQAP